MSSRLRTCVGLVPGRLACWRALGGIQGVEMVSLRRSRPSNSKGEREPSIGDTELADSRAHLPAVKHRIAAVSLGGQPRIVSVTRRPQP